MNYRGLILSFVTFDQRELHRGLCGEVELGLGPALVVLLLLGQRRDLLSKKSELADESYGTYISVGREDLNVADGEDSNSSVPLPLMPVVVHLLLDVDDISFPEGEFPAVLCLEEN